MRPLSDILALIATVAAAIVIGFGVPLLWLWIGSQLQGSATTVRFSVALAIMAGIIASYVGVLWVAGWVMSRFDMGAGEEQQRGTAREPWMRGMTDSRSLKRGPAVNPVERVFVVTVLLVTLAAWVWFLFFAEGGGLPQP